MTVASWVQRALSCFLTPKILCTTLAPDAPAPVATDTRRPEGPPVSVIEANERDGRVSTKEVVKNIKLHRCLRLMCALVHACSLGGCSSRACGRRLVRRRTLPVQRTASRAPRETHRRSRRPWRPLEAPPPPQRPRSRRLQVPCPVRCPVLFHSPWCRLFVLHSP